MAKSIDDYKKDYAAAKALGDAAGMKAANDGANAIRASLGQQAQVASADIAAAAGGSKSSGNSIYDQQHFTADELRQADAIRNAARSGQTSWDAAHNYVENLRKNYGYSGGADGSGYNPVERSYLEDLEKPTYSGGAYDTSGVIDQLINMDYADWTQSDQYKALADRYGIQGRMSMQDVLGQISSRTGGLASSYATTAAQQQYNEYMSQLEEVARQMYAGERSDLAENLSVMNDANDTAYNRYLNELGQYNTDRSFAYSADRDQISDSRYEQEYADSRSDYADSQAATSKADAQNRINAYLAAYGAVEELDPALVSASGYTQSELNTLEKYYADQKAQEQAAALKSSSSSSGSGSKSSSKSSGGSSSSGSGASEDVYSLMYSAGLRSYDDAYAWLRANGYGTTDANRYAKGLVNKIEAGDFSSDKAGDDSETGSYTLSDLNTDTVLRLGIGPISYQTVENLVEQGKVDVYTDSKGALSVRWANGYNKDNYKDGGNNPLLSSFLWR